MSNNQSYEAGSRKGGSKALIVIFAVIVVVLAAIIAVLLIRQKRIENIEDAAAPTRNVLVNEDNVDEILARNEELAKEPVKALSYTVTMRNTTWTFQDGESASPDSWVKNDANNDTDVYFDITRNDTGEIIYKSPIIPLGQEMETVTLDTDLDAGTYDCTMRYSLLDVDRTTVLSTVDLSLTIIIEN